MYVCVPYTAVDSVSDIQGSNAYVIADSEVRVIRAVVDDE